MAATGTTNPKPNKTVNSHPNLRDMFVPLRQSDFRVDWETNSIFGLNAD